MRLPDLTEVNKTLVAFTIKLHRKFLNNLQSAKYKQCNTAHIAQKLCTLHCTGVHCTICCALQWQVASGLQDKKDHNEPLWRLLAKICPLKLHENLFVH